MLHISQWLVLVPGVEGADGVEESLQGGDRFGSFGILLKGKYIQRE